jgi:ElaB/YqjD/DUF883 family membrane-anchored ribosome-binding protein
VANQSTNPGQGDDMTSWQQTMTDSTSTPTPEDFAVASDIDSGMRTGKSTGASMGGSQSQSSGGSQGQSSGSSTTEKLGSKLSDVQSSAADMASNATTKVDEGKDRAASGMESVADELRSRTESMSEGRMKDVADMAAEKMQTGAEMMRSKSTDEMVSELEGMIRRKPMESMLIAAGIGYLLARKL